MNTDQNTRLQGKQIGDERGVALRLSDFVVMFFVAGGVLLYEISITRLLSVVLWYHFAFLAVSLALLGLGVPGVWYSLRPPTKHSKANALLCAGLAIPLSIIVIVHPPWPSGTSQGLVVAGVVLSILVPLLSLGTAVCLLLLQAPGRVVARMYAADLLGATVAACLVVPLMHVVSTPKLLAAVGFLPLGAVLFVSQGWRRKLAAGFALVLALSLLSGNAYQLRHNKSYSEAGLEVLYEKWTPTARLTVFPGIIWLKDPEVEFGWGMGSEFRGTGIEQLWVDQDGSAGTPMTRLQGAAEDLDHLFYDVTSVGFQLSDPETVCIVGAGGGRDILTALKAGAKHVDAVELNKQMIDLAAEVFGEYTGGVYSLPGVRAHASEGRSFLTRSQVEYDLIQISLIDSWAATTAGAYALSENYLYTVEAFELYLERLASGGVLSVSRWMKGAHQLESARLVVLVKAALENAGHANPLNHIAIVQGGRIATVLVSSEPLSDSDVSRLRGISERRGFLLAGG